jgi:hypothetical protein
LLKEYLKLGAHNGLVIIVPAVKRGDQQRLFETALEFVADRNDDLINKVVEVLMDGTVHIREWTSEDHDIKHISTPKWGYILILAHVLYRRTGSTSPGHALAAGKF